MYKLLKDKGNNSNVTLENTETKASVIIGRLTYEILKILEDAGFSFDTETGGISLRDAWSYDIKDETAKLLFDKAMRMKKPIRDQKKKPETPKTDNKKIDAMDVLLGLASYN